MDIPWKGAKRKVMVHFNRNGFAYTIDRGTGGWGGTFSGTAGPGSVGADGYARVEF